MNNNLVIISLVLLSLIAYFVFIWWLRKWMIKTQVPCLWRSLFLAFCLAPGLLLYGEHAGIPIPSFAWMSGAMSAYNCVEKSIFCSIKLNLLISILPFFVTWIFAYFMCNKPAEVISNVISNK